MSSKKAIYLGCVLSKDNCLVLAAGLVPRHKKFDFGISVHSRNVKFGMNTLQRSLGLAVSRKEHCASFFGSQGSKQQVRPQRR